MSIFRVYSPRVYMALDRQSQNVYPIPHGRESVRPNVHEQITLVDSRFTVDLSILFIEREMYRSALAIPPYALARSKLLTGLVLWDEGRARRSAPWRS